MTSSSTQDHLSLDRDLATFIDAEVSLGDEPVAPDTELVLSGLVDSLGVVVVVDWLERRLGIEIDARDVVVENFASVSAIVGYLRGRGVVGG